jgi:hypothetical protein
MICIIVEDNAQDRRKIHSKGEKTMSGTIGPGFDFIFSIKKFRIVMGMAVLFT